MPKSNSLAGNLTVLQENQQPYSNFNRLIVNLTFDMNPLQNLMKL